MKLKRSTQLVPLCPRRSKSVALILVVFMNACSHEDYSNQLQSANALWVLGMTVGAQWEKVGPMTAEDIQELARANNLDRDLWGHELAIHVDGDSWVIAYPGRDGNLDVEDLRQYKEREPVDIMGMYDHDLVFESGGRLLTIASKDVQAGRFERGPLVPPEK